MVNRANNDPPKTIGGQKTFTFVRFFHDFET